MQLGVFLNISSDHCETSDVGLFNFKRSMAMRFRAVLSKTTTQSAFSANLNPPLQAWETCSMELKPYNIPWLHDISTKKSRWIIMDHWWISKRVTWEATKKVSFFWEMCNNNRCPHLFSVSTCNRQCRWCWSGNPLVIEAVRTKRRLWWFVKAPNCRAAPQHHWSPRKAMERPREALQGQEYHV